MKVLMTADAVGGVWSYAMDLCRALDRHGVHVTLATMGPRPGDAQRDEARSCRNLRLVESDYRLEWMAEPWDDVVAAGRWLLHLEQEVRPDIMHVNGYTHARLNFAAPTLVVAHSCVLSWWRAVHGCDAPPEWDRYRQAVRSGLHAADMVVAPSRAMMDDIGTLYGPPADARVILNGRDVDSLPLGARDAFGRYARIARLPEPLVLAAGRLWDPAKNMETLSAAARDIRWPVYVAGSASDPSGARRALDGLHHLGSLSAVSLRRWQQRASVFVHPSLYEPFGLAPLEAALARTALVLADLPSLREIWGDAALFVPPGNAAAIATAVNGLIEDPLLLDRMAEAALRRARTMTARRMAQAYAGVYRELAGRAPRTAPEAVVCVS